MKAGNLDRRITILRASVTGTDDAGHPVRTWTPLATVWAEKRDVSDGERWRAQEVAAHVTTRFRIRWGLGVTTQDRVLHDGREYEIVGPPKEIGRREGQEITAAARGE
jgi:SPP1 family predicted phage head-tail adaptor